MSPFFRRRVSIEKVRDILDANPEQVYYETKSYKEFKYESKLKDHKNKKIACVRFATAI